MDGPLYPDDIVAKIADSKQLAVIERTNGDPSTHSPYPAKTEEEPIKSDSSISRAAFKRFLKDGIPPKDTVVVRWRDKEGLELLPASHLTLLDRSLLIGDIVKRGVNDAMSGTVLNTFTKCCLQPICDITYSNSKRLKGILPPGDFNPSDSQFCVYPDDCPAPLLDVPASELQYAETLFEDAIVVYRDWIGRVKTLTNNILVRLADNCVVEIRDDIGEHPDGSIAQFSVGDLAKTKKGDLRRGKWIFGQYNPNTPPVGTVVSIRTVAAHIAWIESCFASYDRQEPPSILEALELESSEFQLYDCSRRPKDQGSGDPESTISNSEIDIRLNLRVRFKDLTAAQGKYCTPSNPNAIPKLDRRDHLGYDLNVFDVVSFATEVIVQWQDLSISRENSINMVPDADIDDEHAVWPGEVAHTLGLQPVPGLPNVEQAGKIGIIQSVNAGERMAKVRWGAESYAHFVRESEGAQGPLPVLTQYIGNLNAEEEEISLYDIEAPASLNVRRGDLCLITDSQLSDKSSRGNDDTWLGEIVDTTLDGKFIVRLGAAKEARDVTLPRHEVLIAVRSDNTDPADPWNEGSADDDLGYEDDYWEDDYLNDSWDSEDEIEREELAARYEDENGDPMDEEDVEDEEWESANEASDDDVEMQDASQHRTPPISRAITPPDNGEQRDAVDSTVRSASATQPTDMPLSYMVLDGDVPADHYYANQVSTETPAHLKRTHKEHKILRNPSTLPDGVYIRTWETRLDLLRVLLVGPTETPYAHCPFVMDVYLPPSFPTEPPQLFFHSWPAHAAIGAIGRVNPNLYEDGKICLSVLGTWEGNKGESWSPARSTLLQVIVSLLGLVLVREPFYNEAGYETLVGTEESKRPSALYSERIFLRARGFLLTAVANLDSASGLKGLEDIIKWLYLNADGPRLLDATIQDVTDVLRRSDGSTDPDGLTVLSKGACIPGKRLLDRLQDLKAQQQQ